MSGTLAEAMRKTTEAFIDAWNDDWLAEKITPFFGPNYRHAIHPLSMGIPKRNGEQFAEFLRNIEGLFRNAKMTLNDYVADAQSRRAVCRSSLECSTPVGPYINEYIWFVTFNESGLKFMDVVEFMNSAAAEAILRKLGENGHLDRS